MDIKSLVNDFEDHVRTMSDSDIKNSIACATENARNAGMFDVLDRISSSYEWKRVYFLEKDGTIYSRISCRNLSLEDAISEFEDRISWD